MCTNTITHRRNVIHTFILVHLVTYIMESLIIMILVIEYKRKMQKEEVIVQKASNIKDYMHYRSATLTWVNNSLHQYKNKTQVKHYLQQIHKCTLTCKSITLNHCFATHLKCHDITHVKRATLRSTLPFHTLIILRVLRILHITITAQARLIITDKTLYFRNVIVKIMYYSSNRNNVLLPLRMSKVHKKLYFFHFRSPCRLLTKSKSVLPHLLSCLLVVKWIKESVLISMVKKIIVEITIITTKQIVEVMTRKWMKCTIEVVIMGQMCCKVRSQYQKHSKSRCWQCPIAATAIVIAITVLLVATVVAVVVMMKYVVIMVNEVSLTLGVNRVVFVIHSDWVWRTR